jgi:GTP cyclohydrolase I
MSRFGQSIMKAIDKDISVEFINEVLHVLKERLQCEDSYVKIKFPYFLKRLSPVTKNESYSVYECELEGEKKGDNEPDIYLTVTVEYTSCCPCSRNMSMVDAESGKGAHNQRSFCKVKVHLKDFLWIEDLAEIVESKASCEIYNILKRPDEQYVTEKAYAYPKFVEDMSRDISLELDKCTNIDGYVVVTEHFESIHQYNAVAVTRGGSFHIS